MADRPRRRPDPTPPAHPWVLPTIVTAAIVVVVAAVIWASVLGHLF
jgi:hypothetical protein